MKKIVRKLRERSPSLHFNFIAGVIALALLIFFSSSSAFPTFNFSAGTGLTPIGRDKAGVTQSKTIQFSDNVTFTVTPSISGASDQSNTDVAARSAVQRADVVSNAFYRGQSRAEYFDLAAFLDASRGAGHFGNAGAVILQGPGTAAVSLGVAKVFRLTESVHARFETSFTNVLNHTNFAPPATVVDSPSTFGALTAPQTAENAGNRTGQAALQLDLHETSRFPVPRSATSIVPVCD